MFNALRNKITVAEFLSERVQQSGMSHEAIATDAGFLHPRKIELMCAGRAKVPINKVHALSETLGIDAAEFARIVLTEYSPDTLDFVLRLFDDPNLIGSPVAFERVIGKLRGEEADARHLG